MTRFCYILLYYPFYDKRGNPEIINVYSDKEIAEEQCKKSTEGFPHGIFYVKVFPIYPL